MVTALKNVDLLTEDVAAQRQASATEALTMTERIHTLSAELLHFYVRAERDWATATVTQAVLHLSVTTRDAALVVTGDLEATLSEYLL